MSRGYVYRRRRFSCGERLCAVRDMFAEEGDLVAVRGSNNYCERRVCATKDGLPWNRFVP